MSSPKFVVEIIRSVWRPDHTMLEIGCGPAFLRNEFGQSYLGCDITGETYNAEFKRDVDFVCSAEFLSLKDESVDIVIIKSAFYLFKNHKKCLFEAFRVLKKRGMIFIFDYNRKTQKKLSKKEGHNNYPCWTQWGLKKIIKNNYFKKVTLLLPEKKQSSGLKKIIQIGIQELMGCWAIVKAEKI